MFVYNERHIYQDIKSFVFLWKNDQIDVLPIKQFYRHILAYICCMLKIMIAIHHTSIADIIFYYHNKAMKNHL